MQHDALFDLFVYPVPLFLVEQHHGIGPFDCLEDGPQSVLQNFELAGGVQVQQTQKIVEATEAYATVNERCNLHIMHSNHFFY